MVNVLRTLKIMGWNFASGGRGDFERYAANDFIHEEFKGHVWKIVVAKTTMLLLQAFPKPSSSVIAGGRESQS